MTIFKRSLLNPAEQRAILEFALNRVHEAAFLVDAGSHILYVNDEATRSLGYSREELLSMCVADVDPNFPPARWPSYWNELTSKGSLTFETRHKAKDGRIFPVEIKSNYFEFGGRAYNIGLARDITDRKRREEQIELLLREVNHRSKNMLALVQAVARQTVASDPINFLERFGERVEAIVANQDLLVTNEWRGVSLDELSRSQLAHFGDLIGTRVQINGQPLLIEASAAQAIGMALHELATNAGKYGALSNDSGHVTIEWGLERAPGKEDIFFLNWREHGGPPVAASLRRGFGSTVITEMAELSLNAKVDLGFAVAGLTWRLQCRAAEVLGGGAAAPEIEPANAAAPSEHPLAERSRILVVEDEPLVAIEIAHILKKAGFDVIGPARSVAPALSLIEERGCDAAVLDINLGGETSEPVAWRLLTRGAPFVALSGYSRTQHPPVFSGAPALAKPVRPALLVAELRRCLKQGGR